MGQLLDEMSRRYADRIIIFDSPPLLLTSEARALAAHMGQIVMVVEAEQHHACRREAGPVGDRSLPGQTAPAEQDPLPAARAYYGYGHYGYGESSLRLWRLG